MTPLNQIANLYFKREDLNPTGSAKDRALPFQIQNLIKNNYSQAVISSTGNAAISASYFCQQANISLTVFVSPKINPHKLSLIKGHIIQSPQAISDAIKFSKNNHAYLLRQSTDPSAQLGYGQIAEELLLQLPQITSIFVPVGSGTTLCAIAKKLPENVKIFAAQAASNPTIASHFHSDIPPEKDSLTDALSVKYLPLKNEIISAIKKHHGTALAIPKEKVSEYLGSVSSFNSSPESALALAAYYQIKNSDFDPGEYPVILVTGTQR